MWGERHQISREKCENGAQCTCSQFVSHRWRTIVQSASSVKIWAPLLLCNVHLCTVAYCTIALMHCCTVTLFHWQLHTKWSPEPPFATSSAALVANNLISRLPGHHQYHRYYIYRSDDMIFPIIHCITGPSDILVTQKDHGYPNLD